LLSTEQDGAGFTLLNQPLVFGGTMAHIDNRAWHELLVKSAERRSATAKPGSDAPPAARADPKSGASQRSR
jgi:hypothetical protein